jgi:hypothetical protein
MKKKKKQMEQKKKKAEINYAVAQIWCECVLLVGFFSFII